MSFGNDVLLFFAGLVASAINAAAGGGTLLTFPSLLAAGLLPLAANSTSTVGLLTGYFSSIGGYRAEVRKMRGEVVASVVPSIAGGVLGAWLLLALGSKVFNRVIPALLIGSAATLLLQPIFARFVRTSHVQSRVAVFVAVFLISVYAGYFGAGVGILFLAAMGLMYQRDLGQVNAIKVFVSTVSNVLAAVTFIVMELVHPTGAISWRAAAPLAAGALAGGFVGVTIARRLPASALRGFAALVGIGIAVYLIFFK